TALVAGTYYAAQVGDDCESVARTEVTVVITESPARSLTELRQVFCEVDSATVADLNTAGATGKVVWYTSATGGTALAPTAALVEIGSASCREGVEGEGDGGPADTVGTTDAEAAAWREATRVPLQLARRSDR